MLNIGDKVFIRGEIVGVEKDEEGIFKYIIEVPDQLYDHESKRKERIVVFDDNEALFRNKYEE